MWSYSAPDRTTHRPVVATSEPQDTVASHHRHAVTGPAKLRLVPPSDSARTSREEAIS